MPLDLWLYNYARMLFEARWKLYKTGIWEEVEIPNFPEDLSCQSTRFVIKCKEPERIYYFWDNTGGNETKNTERRQLLPNN